MVHHGGLNEKRNSLCVFVSESWSRNSNIMSSNLSVKSDWLLNVTEKRYPCLSYVACGTKSTQATKLPPRTQILNRPCPLSSWMHVTAFHSTTPSFFFHSCMHGEALQSLSTTTTPSTLCLQKDYLLPAEALAQSLSLGISAISYNEFFGSINAIIIDIRPGSAFVVS